MQLNSNKRENPPGPLEFFKLRIFNSFKILMSSICKVCL